MLHNTASQIEVSTHTHNRSLSWRTYPTTPPPSPSPPQSHSLLRITRFWSREGGGVGYWLRNHVPPDSRSTPSSIPQHLLSRRLVKTVQRSIKCTYHFESHFWLVSFDLSSKCIGQTTQCEETKVKIDRLNAEFNQSQLPLCPIQYVFSAPPPG